MLHDTIKYEALFKCLDDDVSPKLPTRSPKRPVAQTICHQNVLSLKWLWIVST